MKRILFTICAILVLALGTWAQPAAAQNTASGHVVQARYRNHRQHRRFRRYKQRRYHYRHHRGI